MSKDFDLCITDVTEMTCINEEKKDRTKMSVEDLINDCGGFGRYQIFIAFGILVYKVLTGWSMLQISYSGYVPDWHCEIGSPYSKNTTHYGNDTDTLNKCSLNNSHTGVEMDCQSYQFEGSTKTVITEWDLVCDKNWVKATITSALMAGVLVGCVVTGQLADMFGRKKTLYGFAGAHTLLNFGAAFSPSWEVFVCFIFFIGSCIGAILVVSIPFSLEFMPTKYRPLMSILPHWQLGISLVAGAAFILKDWSYLHLALGAISIPTLVGWFYVPESVRWLTLKGRYEEAEKIFEKMASVNGRPAPKHTRAVLEKLYLDEQELNKSSKKYTYKDLFHGWHLTKISLSFSYVWFMLSLVCYGISFGISALSGNLYLNIFLVGAVEVPFNFATFFTSNSVGRKVTCLTLLILGALPAIGCIVSKLVFPPEVEGGWITGLSITTRTLLGCAWCMSITWVGESYPTVVRSLGYGLVNTVARIGGILTPFVVDLDNRPLLTYIIINTMLIVGVIVAFFIPDTKGKLLSDSLTRAEELMPDENESTCKDTKEDSENIRL